MVLENRNIKTGNGPARNEESRFVLTVSLGKRRFRGSAMTEEEWQKCSDPSLMLTFLDLGQKGSNRKSRLFAVACCRMNWSELRDERSRGAVEIAERFADGLATQSEMRAAFLAAYRAVDDCLAYSQFSEDQAIAAFLTAARNINESESKVPETEDAHEVVSHVWSYARSCERPDSERRQSHLLRDIFGNPFRPVAIEPAWLTSTVVALASVIYEQRAFDRMPILADALEEAGCDNAEILNHCRLPAEHVRGCWVVDLLTGRK